MRAAGSREVTSTMCNSHVKGRAVCGGEQEDTVEAIEQLRSESEVELSLRSESEVELSLRSESEVELSLRSESEVELSLRSESELELSELVPLPILT